VTFWNQARTDKLLRLWGHSSAAGIAKALGTTKNAVIGKIDRLGLSLPRPATSRRPTPLTFPPSGRCLWLDDDRRFCAEPAEQGSWCPAHRARVYLPLPLSKIRIP
jgi:hypothetical protein